MSRVSHSLVGYDRFSERVVEEVDVPDAALAKAKELARVPTDDPDAIMCYPLDAQNAGKLAIMLDASVDTERHDYFLEGFAAEAAPRHSAGDEKFRRDGPGWAVWVHDDATKDHVKVTVAQATLDAYAAQHGHESARALIDRLNTRMGKQVRNTIDRAIGAGRARMEGPEPTTKKLELGVADLAAALDELGV